MKIEIAEQHILFRLHRFASSVENHCYGEVRFRLMNQIWRIVKEGGLKSTGINHWVYLGDGSMFVGVQLLEGTQGCEALVPLHFELQRYLKHVHVGPYQALPVKWKILKAAIAEKSETIGSHSLEIYGHPCDDESKLETTILIGLGSATENGSYGNSNPPTYR